MRPTDPDEKKPGLWYLATNRLNVLIWRLPLRHRFKALLSHLAYRNPPIPLRQALATISALEAAGVRTVLMGGWGVDALIGRIQRDHRDLDLIVDRSEFARAVAELERFGYRRWNYSAEPCRSGNIEFLELQTMRDSGLRAVELHAVDLDASDLGLAAVVVGERRIECLSPRQQLRAQPERIRTLRDRRRVRAMAATLAPLAEREREEEPSS